jgi:Undecaprenyl-phosphate glucose phosphotransferase
MFRLSARLTNLLLATLDALITAGTFGAVYVSTGTARGPGVYSGVNWKSTVFPWLLFLILPIWSLSFTYFQLYRSQRTGSYFSDAFVLIKGILLGTVLLAAAKTFYEPLPLSREFLLSFVALNFLALASFRLCMRLLLRQLRRRGRDTKTLVVIGIGPILDQILEKIEAHPFYGYKITGVFGSKPKNFNSPSPCLGKLEDFDAAIEKAPPDEVIIALPFENTDKVKEIVHSCENKGIHARIAPDIFNIVKPQAQVYNLDGIPLINARVYPTERIAYAFLKRVFDLIFSSSVLVLLAPLLLLIALGVKLSSRGPIAFKQERVGLNGKTFLMYKFRTMQTSNPAVSDTRWTEPQDQRVTPLGKFLRRISLDELPQLLNVFMGDMSMVGPRPERPHFVEIFKREIPDYMLRHYMKCGITGWAQVNGWRGDTSIRKRIEYDLYYMQHWALWFDIKILLLTLARGLYHRNAY